MSRVAPGEEGEGVTVELHKRETSGSGYWTHPGICTVTFCEGDPKAAYQALRPRLRATIDANPWIAGQLVQGGGLPKRRLVHPTVGSDAIVDDILSILPSVAPISRTSPYKQLVKATGGSAQLTVQSGGKLAKSGARITKLVVLEPPAAGGEFALIFSMSHVVADGHNYYRIFNMIAGNAPVEAMSAVRVAEYETREAEWTGKEDFKWISGGAGLIKGMLGGLLFGPKSSWCSYYVDDAKVEAAKAAAKASKEVDSVTTNDVVTSHFFKVSKARVGMMVVNFRNKSARHPSSLATALFSCAAPRASALTISCSMRSTCRSLSRHHRQERRLLRRLPPPRPSQRRNTRTHTKVPPGWSAVHAADTIAAAARALRLVPYGVDHLVGVLPV